MILSYSSKAFLKFSFSKVLILILSLTYSLQFTEKITPFHEFSMEIINNYSISFQVKNIGSKQGWVGVGFGGDIMENVDYHIFTWMNNGFSYTDSWSHEYESPRDDRSYGGTVDIKNIKETAVDADRLVTYERNTDTNDEYDHVFVEGENPFVVAWWADEGMNKHGSFVREGSINIDFKNKIVTLSLKRHVVWEVHGIILLISWTILNGFGYMAGRMLKHLPFFKWFHLFTSGLNGLLTLVFGVVGLATSKNYFLFFIIIGVEGSDGKDGQLHKLHQILGIIFIVITTLQSIGGLVKLFKVYGANLKNDFELKTKVFHKYTGIILSWVVMIQTIVGGYLLYQN